MAMIPKPIHVDVGTTETAIYTAFIGASATWAQLMSCFITNTTGSDLTIDVYHLDGATKTYFAKARTVPANGKALRLRGLDTIATSGQKWCALASDTGIQLAATVMENGS